MSLVSKEHYDLIDMFEKIFKGQFRFDKEDKATWTKGFVYQHGDANRMFLAFRQGCAYGRSLERVE